MEVEAFETSRAFRASNLGSGQRIEFPLVDGQWDVRDTGDVADEYLGLLARGRQSLDASGSVFDASTTVGRQILPGQSVAYGQSLHWVSRVALDSNARGVRLCAVEKLALTNGWHVHKVQLPEVTYSGDEFMELVQWLERRIRPARPKAWIELPWPRATTEVGFAVYDPADGVLVVRADRLVDIRLADAVTGQNLFERISQQNVNIEGLQTGTYDLFINDTHHETFVVEPETSVGSAAVLVRVAGQVPVALAYVQPMLDALIASGKRSVDLQLTWGHPAVGTIVSLDGRTFGQKGEGGVAVLFSPGMRLDAANLGSLQWTPDRIVATDPSFPLSSRLRERANWLLSVASMENVVQGERVVVPNALRADAVFQRLAMASWRVELGPQVRDMSRSLSEWR